MPWNPYNPKTGAFDSDSEPLDTSDPREPREPKVEKLPTLEELRKMKSPEFESARDRARRRVGADPAFYDDSHYEYVEQRDGTKRRMRRFHGFNADLGLQPNYIPRGSGSVDATFDDMMEAMGAIFGDPHTQQNEDKSFTHSWKAEDFLGVGKRFAEGMKEGLDSSMQARYRQNTDREFEGYFRTNKPRPISNFDPSNQFAPLPRLGMTITMTIKDWGRFFEILDSIGTSQYICDFGSISTDYKHLQDMSRNIKRIVREGSPSTYPDEDHPVKAALGDPKSIAAAHMVWQLMKLINTDSTPTPTPQSSPAEREAIREAEDEY